MGTPSSLSAPDEVVGCAETPGKSGDRLTADELFHVLQYRRRRFVLRYLQGRTETVRMRDVAEQVAAWEHDTTVRALDSTQRQRVYIPLYQNHLPKLDDLDVIEYDRRRGVLERTDVVNQFDPFLGPRDAGSRSRTDDDGWHRSAGIVLLGWVLLLGNAGGFPGFTLVSDFLVGVLLVALCTVALGARLAFSDPA